MKAVQLFDEARRLPPKDQPNYISKRLHEALADGPITIWNPGESIPDLPWRTLIGIAAYSRPDLQLLDAVKEALVTNPDSEESVQIFDVLACAQMNDFDKFIPGIGKVYQTPVLGIWQNGSLVRKESGAMARKSILDRYHIRR